MDNQGKPMQLINHFILAQYVKQLAQSKPKKLTLYDPHTQNQITLIIVNEPLAWIPQNLGKFLN